METMDYSNKLKPQNVVASRFANQTIDWFPCDVNCYDSILYC